MKLGSACPFEDEPLWRGDGKIEVRCPRCGQFTPAEIMQTGGSMGADAIGRSRRVSSYITVEFQARVEHDCQGLTVRVEVGQPERTRP